MERQVLTLEEVNALVPTLTELVGAQLKRREQIEEALTSLALDTGQPRGDLTPRAGESSELRERKRSILVSVDEYQRSWLRLDALGGVLKDPEQGLVDFYGHVDAKLVWLCWRFGETEVAHYHQLDEGFSKRKRIDTFARRMLLN